MLRRSAVLASSALVLLSCAKPVTLPEIKPDVVVIQQTGLSISGLGPTTLNTGDVYRPASYAPATLHRENARYTDMLQTFKQFGTPVRVQVPNRPEPLYGIISFHALPGGASGPATRSYAITVPQSYVDQATGGRVSVVYELVPVAATSVESMMMRPGTTSSSRSLRSFEAASQASLFPNIFGQARAPMRLTALGWVLFLSDRPL